MQLFQNFISGTLSAGITNVETTIAGTALADMVAVAAPDTMYVVLDPEGTAGAPEIVTVTVHTTSATTATVTRASQSTTARAHLINTVFRVAATKADLDQLPFRLLTTTGDILYASAANTATRLAKGTSGLPLVAGAAVPAYAKVGTGGVEDDAITTALIAPDAVTAVEIAAGAVGTTELADDAVTAAKLADDAVAAVAQIAANVVGASELADNAVDTAAIVDLAVTTGKIADSAVTSLKIADGTIVAGDIASDAVTTVKILDANVTTSKIADSNVTTDKINDSAVTSAKIADGTIVAGDIASNAVTTVKILDGNVTFPKLSIPVLWLVQVGINYATGETQVSSWVENSDAYGFYTSGANVVVPTGYDGFYIMAAQVGADSGTDVLNDIFFGVDGIKYGLEDQPVVNVTTTKKAIFSAVRYLAAASTVCLYLSGDAGASFNAELYLIKLA